jgi:uncharacterized protein (TIGR02246 family)
MNLKSLYAPTLFGVALIASSCAPAQAPPPPDTRAEDENALRNADAAWSSAATALEGFLAYYTDDVTLLPPHAPIANGKEAARQALEPLFKMPAFSVKWKAAKVEVARSGDLGYVHGAFDMTLNDPSGKTIAERGKYVEIWRKQADGSWRCIVDMFNSDLPETPQPTR